MICKSCLVEKPLTDFYTGKQKCKLCVLKYQRDYSEKNKDKIKERYERYKKSGYFKDYYKNPSVVSRQKSFYRQASQIAKRAARECKRRAKKLNATPSWLSETQLAEIDYLYWLANDLSKVGGQSYHVDHIVPLQGKNISGLHVPWNLQILPADINVSKGNRT